MNTDRELLSCPFCGKHATAITPWEIGTSDTFEACIECGDCDYRISGHASTKSTATKRAKERWNKRAPAAPLPKGDDLTIGLRVRIDCYGGPFFGTVIGRDVSGGVERIIYRREGDGKKIRHFAGQVKAAAIGKAMP